MTTRETTQLEQIGALHIDGYDWVYVPDELWSQAVFITVINGMEID